MVKEFTVIVVDTKTAPQRATIDTVIAVDEEDAIDTVESKYGILNIRDGSYTVAVKENG